MTDISGVKLDLKAKIADTIRNILSINDKSTTINWDNYYIGLNPRTRMLPFIEELRDLQLDLLAQDEGYFCREDLIEEIAKYVYPPEKYDLIIKKLKSLISSKDVGILLVAAEICSEEDKGIEDIKTKMDHLNGAYNKRGFVLYNWLRSGDVFPIDFLPIVGSRENFPPGKFEPFFKDHWESLLEFHPTRVFVSVYLKEEDLKEEIFKRIFSSNAKSVFIYSRSGRNEIAYKVVTNFIRIFKGNNVHIKLETKSYKIGNCPAKRFEIKILVNKNRKSKDSREKLTKNLELVNSRLKNIRFKFKVKK